MGIAEKKGLAIGIGHVKKSTLEVLQKKIPDLIEQGIEFKFLSQVVDWDWLKSLNQFFFWF